LPPEYAAIGRRNTFLVRLATLAAAMPPAIDSQWLPSIRLLAAVFLAVWLNIKH
jgi:hypothetical protein